MLGRHSFLSGGIYKSKLSDFVFYNLNTAKLNVACIAEQNVTRDTTLYRGAKDKLNNKLRYEIRASMRRCVVFSYRRFGTTYPISTDRYQHVGMELPLDADPCLWVRKDGLKRRYGIITRR
jgi:hypothetical protein